MLCSFAPQAVQALTQERDTAVLKYRKATQKLAAAEAHAEKRAGEVEVVKKEVGVISRSYI